MSGALITTLAVIFSSKGAALEVGCNFKMRSIYMFMFSLLSLSIGLTALHIHYIFSISITLYHIFYKLYY